MVLTPKGRFEAHLEILAGSADESDEQQGMAHVVEVRGGFRAWRAVRSRFYSARSNVRRMSLFSLLTIAANLSVGLLQHIAYMGSRKREALFGTGSQTNAYTDFHHTVFLSQ